MYVGRYVCMYVCMYVYNIYIYNTVSLPSCKNCSVFLLGFAILLVHSTTGLKW